jgi:hypothetical protein
MPTAACANSDSLGNARQGPGGVVSLEGRFRLDNEVIGKTL